MDTAASVVSAVGAILAAMAAFWAVRAQNRNARLSLSLDLLQQVTTNFGSNPMRKSRRNAAASLLSVLENPKDKNLDTISNRDDLVNVWNFFDRVGTLVRLGALDERMVLLEFFVFLQMYWASEPAQQLLRPYRESEPMFYEDAAFLAERITDLYKERRKQLGLPYSPIDVQPYLAGEANLAIDPQSTQ